MAREGFFRRITGAFTGKPTKPEVAPAPKLDPIVEMQEDGLVETYRQILEIKRIAVEDMERRLKEIELLLPLLPPKSETYNMNLTEEQMETQDKVERALRSNRVSFNQFLYGTKDVSQYEGTTEEGQEVEAQRDADTARYKESSNRMDFVIRIGYDLVKRNVISREENNQAVALDRALAERRDAVRKRESEIRQTYQLYHPSRKKRW